VNKPEWPTPFGSGMGLSGEWQTVPLSQAGAFKGVRLMPDTPRKGVSASLAKALLHPPV
jgi:hypothetical protein